MIFNAYADVVYETRATIQIKPNVLATKDQPEKVLNELRRFFDEFDLEKSLEHESAVEHFLAESNLFVLDCFSGLSKEEAIQLVCSNIDCQRIGKNTYSVVLQLKHPGNVATVVNNAVMHHTRGIRSAFSNIEELCEFKNLEVARVGKQVYPQLSVSLPLGLAIGFAAGCLMWTMVNHFRLIPLSIPMRSLTLMLLTFALCLLTGFLIGWSNFKQTHFAALATIKIEPNSEALAWANSESQLHLVEIGEDQHELMMAQYVFIDDVLQNNGLYACDSLVNMAKEECVLYIQENLTVSPSIETKGMLEVRLAIAKPEDCETILNCLCYEYVRAALDSTNFEYKAVVVEKAANAQKNPVTVVEKKPVELCVFFGGLIGLLICLTWCATLHNESEPVLAEIVE